MDVLQGLMQQLVTATAGASAVGSLLLYFGSHYLPLTVIAAFVVMGMLAERKKYM